MSVIAVCKLFTFGADASAILGDIDSAWGAWTGTGIGAETGTVTASGRAALGFGALSSCSLWSYADLSQSDSLSGVDFDWCRRHPTSNIFECTKFTYKAKIENKIYEQLKLQEENAKNEAKKCGEQKRNIS